MAKGDGSVTEIRRADGKSYSPRRWRVCLSYSVYEAAQGGMRKVRRKLQRNVSGTKRDACKVRDAMRRELECGMKPEAETVTFAEFADRWNKLRAQNGGLAESTLRDTESILRRCGRYVGSLRLKDIGADVIESLYAAIREESASAGRPISNARLRKYHIVLKQMFRRAQDYDLILRNPCDRIKAPKCEAPERRSLATDEAAKFAGFLDSTESGYYREYISKEERRAARDGGAVRASIRSLGRLSHAVCVRIGLSTGMRLGEVLGLAWEHVNLSEGVISVKQSLTQRGEIKGPKNGRSRTVSIDARTVDRLAAWKEFQAGELAKLGVAQDDSTPVCCSDIGRWCQKNNFERWWRRFREDAGFPGLRFHELRHTQATQLLAHGVDVKTVQERLGHANSAITLDWYAHALPENDRKAADLMGDLLSEGGKEARIIRLKSA